jgi:hypothetical protein
VAWSAKGWPPTPTSTWSPSPARRAPASGWPNLAAQTVKRVSLELGGKSANIILDDVGDLNRPPWSTASRRAS